MKHFYLYLLLTLLLQSCLNLSVTDDIYYDRLTPSSLSFPYDVNSVAFIDASYPSEDLNTNAFMSILTREVADADYFRTIVVPDSSQLKIMPKVQIPFAKTDCDSLFSIMGTDAIICLYGGDVERNCDSLNAVRVKAILGVYLPEKSHSFAIITDSVDLSNLGIYALLNKEHPLEKLISEKIARHIVPTWQTIDRSMFFSVNYQFRDAAILYKNGDFDGAINIWKEVYAGKSKKRSAYAAYNIMNTYESQDIIDSALVWSDRAEKGFAYFDATAAVAIKCQRENLEQRALELKHLNVQMNKFKEARR